MKVNVKNGNACQFDDFNFICPVTLKQGKNNFEVKVTDLNNQIGISNRTIYFDNGDFNVNILKISGNGVYRVGKDYYFTFANVLMSANVTKDSLIKLFVNGEEILSGDKTTGNFNISLDFKEQINSENKKKISLYLEAEDEIGNIARSNPITLFYNRIVKTFVKIFIN